MAVDELLGLFVRFGHVLQMKFGLFVDIKIASGVRMLLMRRACDVIVQEVAVLGKFDALSIVGKH